MKLLQKLNYVLSIQNTNLIKNSMIRYEDSEIFSKFASNSILRVYGA